MIARARKRDGAELRAPVRNESPGVLLHGISWDLYEQLLEATQEQHLRMTYDRGELEFMSPMPRHEKFRTLARMLIEEAGRECKIATACWGSMTCKKKAVGRGLEPDDCFYIGKHAAAMWKRLDLDFEVDPLPDLAIEIDNKSSSLNRQSVYEALGVPELWRWDGKALRCFQRINGKYVSTRKCVGFSKLAMKGFEKFIRTWDAYDNQDDWLAAFREWISSELKKR